MDLPDARDREIAELRERLTLLSQASLRITWDLDMGSVLQGVVDSARLLTGASRGCITVVDESGLLEDFISSGLSEEDHQGFLHLAGGLEFFTYLSSLPDPLRVADFSAHTTALGLPEIPPPIGPVGSFLSVPIRFQDAYVGNFYFADKRDGEEFTKEDEETLVLFASQAALAIANARRHREEQRDRVGLETLIDTSPVGVVVFDALTGLPRSFNREARRIVDSLRNPDQTPEMLLDTVTCQRADGRVISLREFPLTQALSLGETLRAEEIVISVPDGRSATMLINATPIVTEEGVVESFVVTMQDMGMVKEQERLRAEFLAMVSHELRAPLTSIKGSAATVLGSASELDPAVARQFFRIIEDQADHMNDLVADLLDVAHIETGTLPVSPEPAEAAVLVDRAKNAFTSVGGRNHLEIDVAPNLPLVRADRRRVIQVLVNLLSNAARHSPASSVIRLVAVREGVHVAFSVVDQGRGIPAESLPQLFRKFSVARPEEQGGDTGLGLAICKGIVEAHGGRIRAESEGEGLGARFTFTLPTVEEAGGDMPVAAGSSRREPGSSTDQVRVLAVDDDPQALRYIRDALARAGYQPVVTGEPEEVLQLLESERPDLVLLDMMLPGTDGIELMQAILGISNVPVIFLSAYGREDLITQAFDMGAVDYVVKPFSPTELAARIRSALRRRMVSEPSEPYVLGDLTIDYAERRVTLAGSSVPLVAMEYRLLAELSANGGRVLTYEHLLEQVWGERGRGDLRPMRTMVGKLRRKLGDDAGNPTYIFTEPRVGYRMPRSVNLRLFR